MHVASAKGDVDLIEKLHQKGVDVNLKDEVIDYRSKLDDILKESQLHYYFNRMATLQCIVLRVIIMLTPFGLCPKSEGISMLKIT